ncbi:MAG: response regulator transcription factor [Anaerolineales bacterium]|jgi:DNA-binding response OmpR family regulator
MASECILIVEDERAVARGLQFALQSEGFEVLCAETGQLAIDLAKTRNPSLILLDLRLPDISGFDVCRQLRKDGLRQPILMLTALDDPIDKVLGLELGADDYVVKPYNLRELIARIRSLLRRAYGELSEVSQGQVITFGEIILDLEQLRVTRLGQTVYLTPTEFRLLRYLVTHPDKPINRDTLIEAVWGYDSDASSDRMVDVHIRHLRQKLEASPSDPQWLLTVRGIGYKFQSPH